ncbi:MAG: diguanylate cyclase domain-containing protein [Desulfovibrionales bacterium]
MGNRGRNIFGGKKQDFSLVTDDLELEELFRGLWPEDMVAWTVFRRGSGAVEFIFNQPPDLLIVDSRVPDLPAGELVSLVKNENVYRQLPVVVCMDREELGTTDFVHLELDDFLLRPVEPEVAKSRISLTLNRAVRELDANPLSRLPGNTSIIHRIQELIDRQEDFALAYVDLDFFKSFNDKYGFSRGDEVLMMSARVIVNTIRSFVGAGGFVGHVGGDDFVFILSPDKVETACQRIVENFDSIIPHFYDTEDRKKGSIVSVDRQGRTQEFPLMAISLGVVFNTRGSLKHYGEASQIAMNLKKKAKEIVGSSYVLDRRKSK